MFRGAGSEQVHQVVVGDLDGNDAPDLLLGAHNHSVSGVISGGGVYILFGLE